MKFKVKEIIHKDKTYCFVTKGNQKITDDDITHYFAQGALEIQPAEELKWETMTDEEKKEIVGPMQNKKFKVVVAKNLSSKQREVVDDTLVDMIDWLSSVGWKCRRKSGAFLRRRILGYSYKGLLEAGVTFKRLSSNKLIFGFIGFDDLDVIFPCTKGCQCAEHLGGLMAALVQPTNIANDFTVLYEGHGIDRLAQYKEDIANEA